MKLTSLLGFAVFLLASKFSFAATKEFNFQPIWVRYEQIKSTKEIPQNSNVLCRYNAEQREAAISNLKARLNIFCHENGYDNLLTFIFEVKKSKQLTANTVLETFKITSLTCSKEDKAESLVERCDVAVQTDSVGF